MIQVGLRANQRLLDLFPLSCRKHLHVGLHHILDRLAHFHEWLINTHDNKRDVVVMHSVEGQIELAEMAIQGIPRVLAAQHHTLDN